MKKKYYVLMVFLAMFLIGGAQEKETFNGKSFFKKADKWYDSNDLEVNTQVVTIKFKKGYNLNDNESSGRPLRINSLGFIDLRVPKNVFIFNFVESLMKNEKIESIDINTFGTYSIIPNDNRISQQWYLDKIQMTKTWDFGFGKNNITVAIIDSGIDWRYDDIGIGDDSYQNV